MISTLRLVTLFHQGKLYKQILPVSSKATEQAIIRGHIAPYRVIHLIAGAAMTDWSILALISTSEFLMLITNLLVVKGI